MKNRRLLIFMSVFAVGFVIALTSVITFAQDGSEATATPAPPSTPAPNVVTVSEAFLRAGPGLNYLTVGSVVQDTQLTAFNISEDGGWVLIDYRGGFGWIRRDLVSWGTEIDALPVLSETALTPTSPPTTAPGFIPFPTATPAGDYVQTGNVNVLVRTGPSRAFSRLGRLLPGQIVEPVSIDESGNWVLIRYSNVSPTLSALGIELDNVFDGFGWVARDLVFWTTNLDELPVMTGDNLTPSLTPTETITPTITVTLTATLMPTDEPTATLMPTDEPTATLMPTDEPTATLTPTDEPTATLMPTDEPTATLTLTPTDEPTATLAPTDEPTATLMPTDELTATPTDEPTATLMPTDEPTATLTPTDEPTATLTPTDEPTATPTDEPTATLTPTDEPTATLMPTDEPTATLTPTDEPIATLTPTDEPTATLTPTDEPTESAAVAIVSTPEQAAPITAPDAPPDAGIIVPEEAVEIATSAGIRPELIVGGGMIALLLVYVVLYLRGQAAVDRYAAGFVIETCPVCGRGKLTVETRVERTIGIPNGKHIIRCDQCRSVLRETSARNWRYAVDPLENETIYRRYNGEELSEKQLRDLQTAPQTAPPRTRSGKRAAPPSFVDGEDA